MAAPHTKLSEIAFSRDNPALMHACRGRILTEHRSNCFWFFNGRESVQTVGLRAMFVCATTLSLRGPDVVVLG